MNFLRAPRLPSTYLASLEQRTMKRQQLKEDGTSSFAASEATYQYSWEMIERRLPVPDSVLTSSSIPLEGKIVVVGALLRHVFDINSQSWTVLPPMPTSRFSCASVCIDKTVFVVGGTVLRGGGYTNAVEAITISNNDPKEWETLPPMKTPRAGCAAVVLDGNMVVIGGCNNSLGRVSHFATVEMFQRDHNTWCSLPNMLEPRVGCAAVVVRDCIHVFGGSSGVSLDTAECFDNCWEPLPRMPRCRALGSAVVVGDFVLLIGGMDERGMELSVVDCFDTVTRRWLLGVPPLLTARLCCTATHDHHYQDDVYVFGGLDQEDGPLLHTERIQIDRDFLAISRLFQLFHDAFPLGLWPHVVVGRPPSVIHSILCSERFHLDSILTQATRPENSTADNQES